jgi:hypothetical protein
MVLTAEQHLRIAMVYEKVAADEMGVPPQQRAAFARKAEWFRMLSRAGAKKEAVIAAGQPKLPDEPRGGEGWAPKAKYQTLADRLKTARATAPGSRRPPTRTFLESSAPLSVERT